MAATAKIKPAGTSGEIISLVDMLASFASLTGQSLPADAAPDSFNVLPALTGTPEKPIRDHVALAPNRKPNLAMRQGRWVYIGAQGGGGFGGTQPGAHALGGPAALKFAGEVNSDVENGQLKPDAPKAQLYDLQTDPSQARNVIREHPEVAERLKALLSECQTKSRTAPNR